MKGKSKIKVEMDDPDYRYWDFRDEIRDVERINVVDTKLINEKDLAKKLNVSVYKLQKDRSMKRGMPYTKIFHAVRYDLKKVKEFISKNTVHHE